MKLNFNSIGARLYRFYYGTNQMPSNLCPYFWKLAVAWVTILPLLILTFPGYLLLKKTKSFSDTIGNRVFSLLIVIVCAFIIYYTIAVPVAWYVFNTNIVPGNGSGNENAIVSLAVDGLLILFCIYLFTKETNFLRVPSEFVKSKVRGICPSIEWDDDKK